MHVASGHGNVYTISPSTLAFIRMYVLIKIAIGVVFYMLLVASALIARSF